MSAAPVLDLTSNVEQFALSNVQADYEQKLNDESFAKNQSILNENALQNLRDAPLASVQGLRNAGLSPAFMQPATNVSPGVAPIGNAKTKPVKGLDYNSLVAAAQIRALDAQTAKTDLEAQGIDLENDRIRRQNDNINIKFREYLGQQMEAYKNEGDYSSAAIIQGMLDSDEIFGRGTIEGFKQWDDFQTVLSDNNLQREFKNRLEKLVIDEKMSNDSTLYKIAHLSDAEFDKVIAGTSELLSASAKNYSQAGEADASAHDKTTHAALNLQEIRNLKDSDIAELVSDGEWLRVFSKLGYDTIQTGISTLGAAGKVKLAGSALKQLGRMKQAADKTLVNPRSSVRVLTPDDIITPSKSSDKRSYNSLQIR